MFACLFQITEDLIERTPSVPRILRIRDKDYAEPVMTFRISRFVFKCADKVFLGARQIIL